MSRQRSGAAYSAYELFASGIITSLQCLKTVFLSVCTCMISGAFGLKLAISTVTRAKHHCVQHATAAACLSATLLETHSCVQRQFARSSVQG
jgi:hypothetical protein